MVPSSYLERIEEGHQRSESFQVGQTGGRRQRHHDLNSGVEVRVFVHGDEEDTAAERVADVDQSRLLRHAQNVIQAGR